MSSSYSRRDFLWHSSALTAALLPTALLPSQLQAQSESSPVKLPRVIPNRDTQLKFHSDGTPRPFAGNTVICHLPAQCKMRDALAGLHQALITTPYRNKLGLTTVDSYHMTIFPGANDQDRPSYGWPSFVPADATIEECSRLVGERMSQAHLECALPIRVRVDEEGTDTYGTACTMRMVPLDSKEEEKLRHLRDQLSDLFGFRLKDHDTYQFHVTLSYQLAPFTTEEQTAYRTLLRNRVKQIIAAQPILELGNPEFCTFPDMFRFEPQKLLACS